MREDWSKTANAQDAFDSSYLFFFMGMLAVLLRGQKYKSSLFVKQKCNRGKHAFLLILLGISHCLYCYYLFLLQIGDRNARSILVEINRHNVRRCINSLWSHCFPGIGLREAKISKRTYWLNIQSLLTFFKSINSASFLIYSHYVDKIK